MIDATHEAADSPTVPLPSRRVAVAMALTVGLALVPLAGHATLTLESTNVLIFVLLATSLNLVVGGTGMISMGHAALFAIGGYVGAFAGKALGLGLPSAFALGVAAASLAAFVIGALSVRLAHAYFIMLTLAFGQLVYTVIWKWRDVTGGDDGYVGVMPPAALLTPEAYYWFTLAVVGGCLLFLWRLSRSPLGEIFAALRDNPSRAAAIGVSLYRYRLAAFVLSGAFCGVAGVLQAYFSRGMFADSAHFTTSSGALVAILLGGAQNFFGPMVGGALFILFKSAVGTVTPYWPLLLGVLICLVAITRPDGLLVGRATVGGKP